MGKEFRAIGWAHVVAFLLALVAVLVNVHGHSSIAKRSPVVGQPPHVRFSSSESSGAKLVSRRLYPYSVIPGGVESGPELKSAILRDAVAANHYADFDVTKARVVRLDRDQLAYVSYRMGDKIFWTSKKVKLPKGETVLTDGPHEARTRCGNRVSETPGQPVSPGEPPPQALQPSQRPQQVSILLPPLIEFPPSSPPNFPPGPPPAPPEAPPGGGIIPPPYFPPVGGGGSPPPSTPSTPPVVLPPVSVPEPGTFGMLALGITTALAASWFADIRRRRRA